MRGRWDTKDNPQDYGITGLQEISGRDCGIEEPYWAPSINVSSYSCPQITAFSHLRSICMLIPWDL